MIVKHYDVETAYLNGDLSHEVYMKQPEGYQEGGNKVVCKLKKICMVSNREPMNGTERLTTFSLQKDSIGVITIHACIRKWRMDVHFHTCR